MNCEICGEDKRIMVSLPIKKEDGCLNKIACLECARDSGAYCTRHDRPYMGFEDGSIACPLCRAEAMPEPEIAQFERQIEEIEAKAKKKGHVLGEWTWNGRSWYVCCCYCGATSWLTPGPSERAIFIGEVTEKICF